MEKRLLYAFILTYLVLVVWMKINPAPPPPLSIPDEKITAPQQPPRLKEEPVFNEAQQASSSGATEETFDEKIFVLENERLRLEGTTRGGVIKKALLKDYNEIFPLGEMFLLDGDLGEYRLQAQDANSFVFVRQAEDKEIIKKFVLNDFEMEAILEIRTTGEMSKDKHEVKMFSLDVSRLDKKQRDNTLLEYSIASQNEIFRKTNANSFSDKEKKHILTSIKWAGFRSRYFCVVIKPLFPADGYSVDPKTQSLLNLNLIVDSNLKNGNSTNLNFITYFGPQEIKALSKSGQGFEEIFVFFKWKALDAVAKGINKAIFLIYKVIPNWGVGILIISVLIYLLMYPLTMKGMLSMKRMQALQPELNKLREQHKNNPQKLNKEVMELYKEKNINPLGGCLPTFLQLPIFIGLYQVLWRSVYFKGASFLWIKDLSEPDRLIKFPFEIPFLGEYLNILPIIMVVVMAFQQKISAQSMVAADATQQAQQKMMMTVFPIMLGFIFYNFASGLSLYFTIFYILSTFTQWKVSQATKAI